MISEFLLKTISITKAFIESFIDKKKNKGFASRHYVALCHADEFLWYCFISLFFIT